MQRCLHLACLAEGSTAPNPMVGAVLVYENRIIGEGYHQEYGGPHAEVNCIASVAGNEKDYIKKATMYVSLEPCAHFGKTPPCADLVIENKIPQVVIGCRDPFKEVNGKGVEKLEKANIKVITGVMEKESIEVNRRFFTFHTKHRPYVILKWAQTADGKTAHEDYSRLLITKDRTNRIVHKWRSSEMAILVGTNTALHDNPSLGTRLWPGANPIRLVVDLNLRLPRHLHLFDGTITTIVFNLEKHSSELPLKDVKALRRPDLYYYKLANKENLVLQIMEALYRLNILSVMVEGGTQLLQSFIDAGCWDEARVITNESMKIGKGLDAPVLKDQTVLNAVNISGDVIRTYLPVQK